MPHIRSIAAIVCAGLLLLPEEGRAAPTSEAPQHAAALMFANTLSDDALAAHMAAFQEIADRHGNHREAGSAGYAASAAYLESQLAAAGYRTWRQPFQFTRKNLTGSLKIAAEGGENINIRPLFNTPGTPEQGITAGLVLAAEASGCTDDAWNGVDAKARIALLRIGDCEPNVQVAAAADAGASGVLIHPPGIQIIGAPYPLPVAYLNDADGEALTDALAQGEVVARLNIRRYDEQVDTFNILAETTSGKEDSVIMLGAHLDSVRGSPGMVDNASGAAAVLELARHLANGPVQNRVRFGWWGAEEYGLLGSCRYTNELAENAPESLTAIRAYLNLDMLAAPNYIIGVYDPSQSPTLPPPPGSALIKSRFTEYFDAIHQPWIGVRFDPGTDHLSFVRHGIAAGGLASSGDHEFKTAEEAMMFGGSAGAPYDPNYHDPGDKLDNADTRPLRLHARALAYATMRLAQDTSLVNRAPTPPSNAEAGAGCWPDPIP